SKFEKRIGINFGIAPSTLAKKMLGRSFAEAEEFALSVYRQYVLRMPEGNITEISQNELKLWESQVNISLNKNNGGEE
ncbi:MAG: family ATPase, partial [Clostridiales bacterium]|nr:family ATPase [Clostridiales bacterium]